MQQMPCPLNGLRNINEFHYGGEVRNRPELSAGPAAYAEYVFYANNRAEYVREWWQHSASGYWFIVERHRASGDIRRSFDPAELFANNGEAAPR